MNTEVFIVGIVFFSIVTIVKIIADTITRRRLMDKGLADEKFRELYAASHQMQSASSLKWGMVLVGIGVAVLVGQLFPRYISDEVTFGLMFIFAGVGFLVYYPLAVRKNKDGGSGNQGPM